MGRCSGGRRAWIMPLSTCHGGLAASGLSSPPSVRSNPSLPSTTLLHGAIVLPLTAPLASQGSHQLHLCFLCLPVSRPRHPVPLTHGVMRFYCSGMQSVLVQQQEEEGAAAAEALMLMLGRADSGPASSGLGLGAVNLDSDTAICAAQDMPTSLPTHVLPLKVGC